MALARTPLDPSGLGPEAQRALAPGPTRMMAASGLAPVPRPGELISVLYQLTFDEDAAVRDTAAASARDLPERVLEGALSDDQVDPRVLDYFAELVAGRGQPALLHKIILNPATADETIATLAGSAGTPEVDLIAQNEQRLLRHPDIIAAMFKNPKARMSTVDRAVELAARNQVQVSGIPSWEALAASVKGQGGDARDAGERAEDMDALFAQAAEAATGPDTPESDQGAGDPSDQGANGSSDQGADGSSDQGRSDKGMPPVHTMSVPMKIRLATMGNAFARAQLIRDPNRVVATAAIKAPTVTDVEAAKYAGNHSLNDDVIKYIAGRRDWTKSYGVKLALIQNPKTPIPDAIRFMPHLRERDLRNLARSKNVSSAVAAQARKLIMQRRGKK